MKNTLFCTCFLLVANALTAQVNMNDALMEPNPFLCQPGVINKAPGKGASFTYTFNPDYKMLQPGTEQPTKVQRNERFETRLKLPILNTPGLKAMLGFEHTLERYHFLDIDPDNYPLFKRLNEAELKNLGIAAYVVHPINHKYYTCFRLSANWQGDYSTFISLDNRYAVYRLAGVFGVKKRDDLEYGAGILLNKGYRGTSVVPFGFYNQTFNDHWGVEAILPSSIKIRYNFNDRQLAMFGTELSSQNYALNVKEPVNNPFVTNQTEKAPYHFSRSSLDLVGSFYQQLTGWTWLQFKVGYAFRTNATARDLPERLTYDLKPSGSMVGVVSFFLSPPKQCMEKVYPPPGI
ncbi:MAG: hypothetical protein HY842_02650 [Bacteroidetes bacterium]|nr:hypothetical protein [Bacteroidota bacterium]